MYSALLKQLDDLRLRTARFCRVALHLHSPDSKDWAILRGDLDKNKRERFFETEGATLYLKELYPHFDLVAVTDHMKCGYACRLSEASNGSNGCIVLPGMEINFKPDAALSCIRIHLIVFCQVIPVRKILLSYYRHQFHVMNGEQGKKTSTSRSRINRPGKR